MITVHHLENSRSTRVLFLLEELGLDYEIKRYKRDPKTSLAPPELQAVHPLGKSPVITDGDRTVAESAVILHYLASTYGDGGLVPAEGTEARHRYDYWMHYAEGSLMPYLVLKLITTRIKRAKVPFFVRPVVTRIGGTVERSFVHPNLDRHTAYLEAELGKEKWACGADFTAADVQLSYPVLALTTRYVDPSDHPAIGGWLERLQARPAWKTAIEKGGQPILGR